MCTLAAKKLDGSWHLIKTRDPVPWMRLNDEIKLFKTKSDKYKKLIIQNPDPKEDGYYGGINEKGIAIVATFLPIAENQVSFIRRPYIRLILEASTANEAVEIIKSFNPRIGGNFFVADEKECYEIEGAPKEYSIRKIDEPTAKTNHFLHLPYENLQMKDPWFANWTQDRLKRAQILIKKASNLEDLKNILKDRENSEKSTAICMLESDSGDNPPTYSAFIFDTGNKVTYYCQGNPTEKPFKKYSF